MLARRGMRKTPRLLKLSMTVSTKILRSSHLRKMCVKTAFLSYKQKSLRGRKISLKPLNIKA